MKQTTLPFVYFQGATRPASEARVSSGSDSTPSKQHKLDDLFLGGNGMCKNAPELNLNLI